MPLEEVPAVWEGVASIFRDYGYRKARNRARLKYLMADWGPLRFREVLEQEYLHRALLDGPAPAATNARPDHVGVHPQRDGRMWVGLVPTVGRVSGSVLAQLADAAEAAGSKRIRLTAHQKLLVLDVAPDRVETLVAQAADLGLQANPSQFRRGALACTGIEYCKLALVETKARAAAVVEELETALPQLDAPLSIHFNGCPNACARTQVADIGLKGMVLRDAQGALQEVFQVHLGGQLGTQAQLARKTRALRVGAAELPGYVERLVRRYLAQRQVDESFAQWANRAVEEDLR